MTRFENANPAASATLVVVGLLVLLVLAGTSTAMIALAGVGRLSPDIDPARVPAWLWHYRADPDLQRWLRIGGLINILLAVVIVAAVALSIRRPLHGAAHWAATRDLKGAGLAAREGILLGRRGRSWLIAGGSEHVMLYAPTRTGKGVGIVIPNLLTWPGSVVVLDIKRENYEATAGFRAAAGQTVLLFDPLAPDDRTARFNPLAHITRSSASAVLDELQRMAVMLFPGHDHADPFWSEAARTGFIG
ncbi:MAG TPA: type IV secretory system conjugative DNA transfer family protein, partial [Mycoplana sp.]|nr:type IV secretory system conjugative DNA transfer family protein [Mycoplana sp.]